MYKKLHNSLVMDYKVLDKQIEFDLTPDGKKIQYYNVSSMFLDEFISSLGPYGKHFYSKLVVIEADVPPHTDIMDKTSFNFYIETGDYNTVFYSSKDDSVKVSYADHGDGHAYSMDDIEVLGSFVANPGDGYLLNGKVIHGVSSPSDNKQIRKFLQVSTNTLDYDQVSNILRNVW
jgi:hypothetical protein